jgi:hypothetical protein
MNIEEQQKEFSKNIMMKNMIKYLLLDLMQLKIHKFPKVVALHFYIVLWFSHIF